MWKKLHVRIHSKEYRPICQRLDDICHNLQLDLEVKDLYRIENVRCQYMYERLKETVTYDNCGEDPQITGLFHGCPPEVTQCIIAGGLNRIYCHPTGRLGCATYVTNCLKVALEHSTEDPAGHRYVFICDAIIGHYCQGLEGHRVPPIRRLSTLQRYDSTVDDLQNPTKFAVFQDNSILIRHLPTLVGNDKPSTPVGQCLITNNYESTGCGRCEVGG